MKIKVFLLTLVVIFNIFLVTGCGEKNREYDAEVVKEAALKLLPESKLLNELYYGYGIAYLDDKSEAEGRYYKSDFLSCQYYGVDTVEDIKVKTRKCYSTQYADIMINTKLSSVTDDEGAPLSYVRYYQKKNVLDGSDECIMVDKEAIVLLKDKLEYDLSSVFVSHSEGEEVIVTVNVKVTNNDNKTQNKTVSFSMIEEDGEWKINSPTYVTYFDRTDYDNIQK